MGSQCLGMGLGVPSGVITKEIPNTDGLYVAGSDGHVYCYSESRVNSKKPKPFRLSESIGSNGYPFVSIVINGRRKTKAVHTLVCTAFHGLRPSDIYETRHMDGNKCNSAPGNLLWGTPGENEADKRRHGRVAKGQRHGQAKLTDEAVRILRASIPIGLWNAADAARVFGVDPSVIKNAVRGVTWRHVQ